MPFRGNLVSSGSNSKIIKGDGPDWETGITHLKPDDELCPWSKRAKCQDPCLVSAGRGKFNNVQKARQRKSDLYHSDRDLFMELMYTDLIKFEAYCLRKSDKEGNEIKPAYRPNGTSDIPWERVKVPSKNKTIIELFHDTARIKLYDYTKTVNRVYKDPYPLTLSWSGADKFYENKVMEAVDRIPNLNLAIVFRTREMLEKAMKSNSGLFGRTTIDGDKSDLRFLDPVGVNVGLVAKGKAKTDTSGFVYDYTH